MKAIHQLVAGFTHGDAISNEAVVMRGIFRSWGFESDIFVDAERIAPSARSMCRPLSEYRGGAQDAVVTGLLGGKRVAEMERVLPALTRKLILPEAGHWIQQERPAEVNAALIEFLKRLEF